MLQLLWFKIQWTILKIQEETDYTIIPLEDNKANKPANILKSRKEKSSETDSIKFKISPKTPRGKKGQHKKTSP